MKSKVYNLSKFSLDHLSPEAFENFCVDLLSALGFINISWRKGTGLDSSPSDSGRDIECELISREIDGQEIVEKWFIECKHHKKGISPKEIQPALTWALAESPDMLLIIASNFLSNPTKDLIKKYSTKRQANFKIKIWELPDIERLVFDKSNLQIKYELNKDVSFLSILQPAHLKLIKWPPFNSLDYFFQITDHEDPDFIEKVLSWAIHLIVRPRMRDPIHPNEKLKDLLIDDVSYSGFKKRCYEIVDSGFLCEEMLVLLIVTITLNSSFSISDLTSKEAFIETQKMILSRMEKRYKETNKENLPKMIREAKDRIKNADNILKSNYQIYERFCKNIVEKLFLEEIY